MEKLSWSKLMNHPLDDTYFYGTETMSTSLSDIVKDKVHEVLSTKKNDMSGAFIDKVHPEINVRYNSVNVIVGKQGQGKTVIALEEIIKIALMDTHHLLVYVTKDGNESDRSFLALKSLIEPRLPIITISESSAEATIEKLIKAKNEYYAITNNHLEDKLDDPQLNITPKEIHDLFDTLHIDDFHRKYLHTLVLFDDISNSKLFTNETSYFSQLLRRCRHTNMTFFLLIQGWKGLKPHIKNEITTLMIFPCFNKQQLRYIYSQSASNLCFDDFYEKYEQIMSLKTNYPDSHPYMVIQVVDGGETFIQV